jgi:hypothetical protein
LLPPTQLWYWDVFWETVRALLTPNTKSSSFVSQYMVDHTPNNKLLLKLLKEKQVHSIGSKVVVIMTTNIVCFFELELFVLTITISE